METNDEFNQIQLKKLESFKSIILIHSIQFNSIQKSGKIIGPGGEADQLGGAEQMGRTNPVRRGQRHGVHCAHVVHIRLRSARQSAQLRRRRPVGGQQYSQRRPTSPPMAEQDATTPQNQKSSTIVGQRRIGRLTAARWLHRFKSRQFFIFPHFSVIVRCFCFQIFCFSLLFISKKERENAKYIEKMGVDYI